jgi:hypothetical protein
MDNENIYAGKRVRMKDSVRNNVEENVALEIENILTQYTTKPIKNDTYLYIKEDIDKFNEKNDTNFSLMDFYAV